MTTMNALTLAALIFLAGWFIALQHDIAVVNAEQQKAWAEAELQRKELANDVAELNAKLAVQPHQVLDQVKALRLYIEQQFDEEAREAWHVEQHKKWKTTVNKGQ